VSDSDDIKIMEIDGIKVQIDNTDLQFAFCDLDPFSAFFAAIDRGEDVGLPVKEALPTEKCRRRRVKGRGSRRRPYRRDHRHGSNFWRGRGKNG
jgi:hypothetical protein